MKRYEPPDPKEQAREQRVVQRRALAAVIPDEHTEQAFFFQRIEAEAGKTPELRLVFAVPNGGLRSPRTAGRLKAEGVKSGVPDIIVPVPRWPFHGAYIEMKKQDATPSDVKLAQKYYIESLRQQGYAVFVCRGMEQAFTVIMGYLALDMDRLWGSMGLTRIKVEESVAAGAGLTLERRSVPG